MLFVKPDPRNDELKHLRAIAKWCGLSIFVVTLGVASAVVFSERLAQSAGAFLAYLCLKGQACDYGM